ncbi:MAG: hypothetical protein FWC50_12815 [Planctomycetaceae bacterium]|nr:hypothetical protein [Planctomycetaceae bacterium]
MTSRKAQWFTRYFSGFCFLAAFTGAIVLLFSSVTFAQSGNLRWKSPVIGGQQSTSQPQSLRPAIPSSVQPVQYLEPIQPSSATDSEAPRIAQAPSSDAIRDTVNPERRPQLTPNMPVPSLGGTVAPPLSTFSDPTTREGVTPLTGTQTSRQILAECRDPRDPKLFKPMQELTVKIDFPIDLSELNMCPINVGTYQERNWAPICFQYNASSLCHKAAYFEDISVERYGHSWGPFLQPVISAGKFYMSVVFLPYKIGLTPPQECVYAIGYYRPGSCAPHMIDPLPISVRAGLMQAGTVVGLSYMIP